ncbi:MAG: hypothetical protein PARBB_02445 [Parabacteroides distasonis]|uniref:MBL fold metallo-hydrolase n=1 Tax=Parabacteroides sp. TaxID=1869337 RepID=UPI00257F9371|nr:MBL fold metallo-hydrolase [Parabacteroides sp.]
MMFIEVLERAFPGATHLFSMGQAGYILKSKEGQTLAIDLYLSECVEPIEGHDGYHRLMPQIVKPKDLLLDIVVATHFHRDHFDIDVMADLMSNEKTMLFCAYDCEKDVKRLGIDESRVIYVKPGDHHRRGAYTLDFINCDHGMGAPLAVGVIITVDGKRILEVGDTCLRLERRDEYLRNGLIDVLIAPINGEYGNMNELECAELAKALDAKETIPCHFGMFASHGGNAGVFIEQMRKQGSKYKIMTMGEDYVI